MFALLISPFTSAQCLSNLSDSQTVMPAGKYKVGTDIKAGEYKIFAGEHGRGTIKVMKTPDDRDLDSLIHAEAFENQSYIRVNDGEYLTVNFATFVLVE